MFSSNIFGGTFNIDVVKQSMKEKFTSSKKASEDNMTPTVNKCVQLKSELNLNVLYS